MNSAATPQPGTSGPAPLVGAAEQAKYQVRFDWGPDGAARIAPGADVLVWVDVLGPRWRAEVGAGPGPAGDQQDDELAGLLALLPQQTAVVSAGFGSASAAAEWITAHQHALGRRAMIAIVAAGGPGPGPTATGSTAAGSTAAGPRFAVENLLAAGAVIDALAVRGTDFSSPEAAAACAAFTGLRGAVAHLLTASVSAQRLVASGLAPSVIRAAGVIDALESVTVVRA